MAISQKRVDAFLKDLTELSGRHGIVLCGSYDDYGPIARAKTEPGRYEGCPGEGWGGPQIDFEWKPDEVRSQKMSDRPKVWRGAPKEEWDAALDIVHGVKA